MATGIATGDIMIARITDLVRRESRCLFSPAKSSVVEIPEMSKTQEREIPFKFKTSLNQS